MYSRCQHPVLYTADKGLNVLQYDLDLFCCVFHKDLTYSITIVTPLPHHASSVTFYSIPSTKNISLHPYLVPISTAPSPPRMLTMTGAPTGSTVELNWLPPLHPNGAIHYEIEYEPATAGMSAQPVNAGSRLFFTLTLPNEIKTHRVTVVAVNSKGRARSNELEVVVAPGMNTETGILYMQHAHVCCNAITLHVFICVHICACVSPFNVQVTNNI